MRAGIEISEIFFCENFPVYMYGKSFAHDSAFTNLVTNQDIKTTFVIVASDSVLGIQLHIWFNIGGL